MSWRLAKCLEVLRKQVNVKYPNRSKDSDGSIGDANHASRSSDHNPWITGLDGVPVVSAIDITHDPANGFNSYAFADMLKANRDPRIKYIISNHRIWNPSISDAWRVYTGPNPHDHHVHISVKDKPEYYDSTQPWTLDSLPPPIGPMPTDKPRRSTVKLGDTGENVRYLQAMLGIPVTEQFDEITLAAVKAFQARYRLVADGIVGPYTWRQLEA